MIAFTPGKITKRKQKKIIHVIKKSTGNDLLEIGCGTGKHSEYLKDLFSILAMDLSKDMLDVARKNIKGVSFKKGDMVNFDLDKKFDVIICLFSSIGYVKTYKRLAKTIENFAHHLKTGGVVIIEPWLTKSTYITGLSAMPKYSIMHFSMAIELFLKAKLIHEHWSLIVKDTIPDVKNANKNEK